MKVRRDRRRGGDVRGGAAQIDTASSINLSFTEPSILMAGSSPIVLDEMRSIESFSECAERYYDYDNTWKIPIRW
jgi:hypothetical protein